MKFVNRLYQFFQILFFELIILHSLALSHLFTALFLSTAKLIQLSARDINPVTLYLGSQFLLNCCYLSSRLLYLGSQFFPELLLSVEQTALLG